MVIFLAGAVPLSCALVLFGYLERRDTLLDLGRPAARGILNFVISYLVYWLLKPVIQLDYTFSGIYIYYLVHENLYFLAWCVVSYLIYYQVPHTDAPAKESVPALIYFTAFFSPLAISDILLNKTLTAHVLFLLPLSRVGVIMMAVGAIVVARRMYLIIRYALLLIPFTASAAAAMVPTLFFQQYSAPSILLAVGLFSAGGLFFFLSTKK